MKVFLFSWSEEKASDVSVPRRKRKSRKVENAAIEVCSEVK